jgi:succinate dehydrogenase/fumarate reductase flavoprotein subunit
MAYGNGLGAAYRVGAQMRNAEFATEPDVVYSATFQPVYRGHNLVHNKDGVNISDIYAPTTAEVTTALILGMYKEVKEGRGPLYVDLSNPDPLRSLDDPVTNVNNQRFFPDKLEWGYKMKTKAAKFGKPITETPEVTAKFMLQAECVKVDREYRTNVDGLWAPGKMSDKGSAYFGFVRGDGLGNALQSGMRAAVSMAKYAASAQLADLDVDQVKALKDKIYAPLNRKTTRKPSEIFNKIEVMAYDINKMMAKTDETIRAVLSEVEEMYKIVPDLTADDAHTLAKCLEAADSILALEMIYSAALMRTESRGGKYKHYRADYPNRDDKNWLKWINIQQGKDGKMELFTEDIPMERYPFKPKGWAPSATTA